MRRIKTSLCLLFIFFSANLAIAQKEITFSIENVTAPTNEKYFYKTENSLIQYYGRIQTSQC